MTRLPEAVPSTSEGESCGVVALPLVSVVIPHLNQPAFLERCLASLAAQDWPADRIEIIVVDNGSRCDLDAIRAAHPEIRLLEEAEPGPGLARNRGVMAASGDILAFIDADCRAHPGWIRAIVDAARRPDFCGTMGGDVRIDARDPARLTPLEAYESVFAFRQRLYIEKHGYSGTGNLAILPEVFRTVGPFGGIAIAEDMDWGRRAIRAGHGAIYCPEMIVYHPARTQFSELQAKWRRHVAHQLAEHRARGRGDWRWAAQAVAVLLSALPHCLKLLGSDRLAGLGNRLRGVPVLFRIRVWRSGEMLRQARATGTAAAAWNRA